MIVSGVVTGQEVAGVRLRAIPDKVRSSLLRSIQKLSGDLANYVVRTKLSGQVLKRRTGVLAGSIQPLIAQNGGEIIGRVGPLGGDAGKALPYARKWEYGFSGTEPVRAHSRMMTQAWGRPVSPHLIQVRAHTRRLNLPARSFLRTSLEENREAITAALADAVRGAGL
jgi:hypothetical protein